MRNPNTPGPGRQIARGAAAIAIVAVLSGCEGSAEPEVRDDEGIGAASTTSSATVASAPSPPRTGDSTFSLDGVQRFAAVHEWLRASGIDTGELTTGAEIETIPPVVRFAVEEAGLTLDEFLEMNSVLLPALFVARLREAGLPAAARPGGVDEAHVDFVEAHRAEIEALLGLEER